MTDLTATARGVPARAESGGGRLWFVDHLKVALTCLVILHHVVVTYSGIGLWYYTEKPDSPAVGLGMTLFLLLNQAWFMGAFFLLSGYFTPGSHDRKGFGAFLRDRLIRLGLPLLVFYFVLEPVLMLGTYHGGSVLHWYVSAIGSGPLWFVLVLLVLDTVYGLFRRVSRRPAHGAAVVAASKPPSHPMVVGLALALALVTYAWRIVVPIGFWIPVAGLPTGDYLPQYVGFFVVGIVAHRRGWFHSITGRMGVFGLCLAVGATLVFLPLALSSGGAGSYGGGTLHSLWYAVWDTTFAVGLCLALLTFFRHRLNGTGPVRRYLARNTFTVYVTHAFVVTAAGYALSFVALPTLAKVAIVAVVALPACFAVAGPIRRIPGVRRVL